MDSVTRLLSPLAWFRDSNIDPNNFVSSPRSSPASSYFSSSPSQSPSSTPFSDFSSSESNDHSSSSSEDYSQARDQDQKRFDHILFNTDDSSVDSSVDSKNGDKDKDIPTDRDIVKKNMDPLTLDTTNDALLSASQLKQKYLSPTRTTYQDSKGNIR